MPATPMLPTVVLLSRRAPATPLVAATFPMSPTTSPRRLSFTIPLFLALTAFGLLSGIYRFHLVALACEAVDLCSYT